MANGHDLAFSLSVATPEELLFAENFEGYTAPEWVPEPLGAPWLVGEGSAGADRFSVIWDGERRSLQLGQEPFGTWDAGQHPERRLPAFFPDADQASEGARQERRRPVRPLVRGDGNTPTTYGAIRIEHTFQWAGYGIVVFGPGGGTANCEAPGPYTEWTTIDVRNINVAAQTFDVHVNGVPVCTARPFLTPTTQFTRVYLGVDWSSPYYFDDLEVWH